MNEQPLDLKLSLESDESEASWWSADPRDWPPVRAAIRKQSCAEASPPVSEEPTLNLDAIDHLVAEKVMRWEFREPEPWHTDPRFTYYYDAEGQFARFGNDWKPTRNRGDALLVFERCEWMTLAHWAEQRYMADDEHAGVMTYADTPMLAICLAALKRAGVEVPGGAG